MSKTPNCKCKICGKLYRICADARRLNSWRLIACSPECYQEWLRKVEISKENNLSNFNENVQEEISNLETAKPSKKRSKKNSSESVLESDSGDNLSSKNSAVE